MNLVTQLNDIAVALKHEFPFILHILAIVWCVQLVNVGVGNRLKLLGILPRTLIGMPGVLLSSFIHGDWNHLFTNSLFFVAMGSMVIINGKKLFYTVSLSIILISGSMVWLCGRRAWHVGASSLIMGYWSFLMTRAYFNPNLVDLISAGLGVYYCGIHLTASLMANGPGVSEEGHISGFIAGIVTAVYYESIAYQLSGWVALVL